MILAERNLPGYTDCKPRASGDDPTDFGDNKPLGK